MMDETRIQTDFQRIHIIGGPGSGKSTLARALGRALSAPVYELDKIAFEGQNFCERPLEIRLREVHEIARQPQWISEGIFIGWMDELARNAEVILWLDTVPWHDAMWRIVLRFCQNGWREVGRQRGVNKFLRVRDYHRNLGQLWGVLFSSHSYYKSASTTINGDIRNVTRAQTAEYLASHMDKVIQIRNHQASKQFLSSMHTGTANLCGALPFRERGWG